MFRISFIVFSYVKFPMKTQLISKRLWLSSTLHCFLEELTTVLSVYLFCVAGTQSTASALVVVR